MIVTIDRNGTIWGVRAECSSAAEAATARRIMENMNGGRGVHDGNREHSLWTNCRRRDAESVYAALRRVDFVQPTQKAALSRASVQEIADRYVARPAPDQLYKPSSSCRCRLCGTTAASRFTTLPASAMTCDDCA